MTEFEIAQIACIIFNISYEKAVDLVKKVHAVQVGKSEVEDHSVLEKIGTVEKVPTRQNFEAMLSFGMGDNVFFIYGSSDSINAACRKLTESERVYKQGFEEGKLEEAKVREMSDSVGKELDEYMRSWRERLKEEYNKGFEEGQQALKEEGFDEGYKKGLSVGKDMACEQCKELYSKEGYDKGFKEGEKKSACALELPHSSFY